MVNKNTGVCGAYTVIQETSTMLVTQAWNWLTVNESHKDLKSIQQQTPTHDVHYHSLRRSANTRLATILASNAIREQTIFQAFFSTSRRSPFTVTHKRISRLSYTCTTCASRAGDVTYPGLRLARGKKNITEARRGSAGLVLFKTPTIWHLDIIFFFHFIEQVKLMNAATYG